MTETEFIESIDCQFPYHVESEWRSLIELGASISPNAAFMVLHELCRLPSGTSVEPEAMQAMLTYWRQHFGHPLVTHLLPLAEAMIQGKTVSVAESMRVMRTVAPYRDQYNALSIPYFACDDAEGRADELYQEIINSWESA